SHYPRQLNLSFYPSTGLQLGGRCRFCHDQNSKLLITGNTISNSKFIHINLAAKIVNNIKRS
ncbi:hypothetical protein ACWGXC_32815, partial [Klebsiella pneumoniae]